MSNAIIASRAAILATAAARAVFVEVAAASIAVNRELDVTPREL